MCGVILAWRALLEFRMNKFSVILFVNYQREVDAASMACLGNYLGGRWWCGSCFAMRWEHQLYANMDLS